MTNRLYMQEATGLLSTTTTTANHDKITEYIDHFIPLSLTLGLTCNEPK